MKLRFTIRALLGSVALISIVAALVRAYLLSFTVIEIRSPADCEIYLDDKRLGSGTVSLSLMHAISLGISRDAKTGALELERAPYGFYLKNGKGDGSNAGLLHLRRSPQTDSPGEELWQKDSSKQVLLLDRVHTGWENPALTILYLEPQQEHVEPVCTLVKYDGNTAVIAVELPPKLLQECKQFLYGGVLVSIDAYSLSMGQMEQCCVREFDPSTCKPCEFVELKVATPLPGDEIVFFGYVNFTYGQSLPHFHALEIRTQIVPKAKRKAGTSEVLPMS